MRIGLFIPCYIDAFFPQVGIATLELLERFGHEVEWVALCAGDKRERTERA
jgi:L-lactate dehydrogenase complex protein LldE